MIDRVVVINDIAVPKGGATALALLSAAAFTERGLAVTYLSGDDAANPALAAAGVEMVGLGQARLTSSSFIDALAGGLYNRRAKDIVADWIARNDTPGTVYHLHGWAQIFSPAIFDALQAVGARTVLSAHDFFLACPNGSFAFLRSGKVCPHRPMSVACVTANCDRRSYAQKLWRVARQAVQRHYFDRANSPPILAIHEGMRPFLMRAGIPSHAIHTLPNPITPFSDRRIAAETNREALFVGRLESTKGPDMALAACRRAGVTLRLIGDGVMRGALEAEFPEMIFMGHQTPADIRAYAAQARMLLMPSRYPEPFGLVAVEALWSGLPVVLTDTALLADNIVDAGAGTAIEPRDVAGFARAIGTIAADDQLAAKMSHAAFTRTRSFGLTPSTWIDRLIEHYEAAIAPTRDPSAKVLAGAGLSAIRGQR